MIRILSFAFWLLSSISHANHQIPVAGSTFAHWNGRTFVYQTPTFQIPQGGGGWSYTTVDRRDAVFPDLPANTKQIHPAFYDYKLKEKAIYDARNRGEEVFPKEREIMAIEHDQYHYGSGYTPQQRERSNRELAELKKQKEEWFKTTKTYERQQTERRQAIQKAANEYSEKNGMPFRDPCGCDTCLKSHESKQRIFHRIQKNTYERTLNEFKNDTAASLFACAKDRAWFLGDGRGFDQKIEAPARQYLHDFMYMSEHRYRAVHQLDLPDSAKQPFLDYITNTLQASYELIDGVKNGTLQAFQNHAVTLKEAMQYVMEHPGAIARFGESIMNTIGHPESIGQAVVESFSQMVLIAKHGSAYELGEAMGSFAADTLITAAELTATGPITSVAKEALITSLGGKTALSHIAGELAHQIKSLPQHGPQFALIERQLSGVEARDALHNWSSTFKLQYLESADRVNYKMATKNWATSKTPPFQPGTQVAYLRTMKEDVFVRVHYADNRLGSWMMRKESIQGLTAEQIQIKYNLPKPPTHFTEVHVPKDTNLVRGKVGDILRRFENMPGAQVPPNTNGAEGAIQYRLTQRISQDAYKNTRPIEELLQ